MPSARRLDLRRPRGSAAGSASTEVRLAPPLPASLAGDQEEVLLRLA